MLHVQDGDQAAIRKLRNRGNEALVAGQHVLRRFDLIPVDSNDAVDFVHQEALGVAAEFGDDQRLVAAIGRLTHGDEARQRNHGNDVAAQGDEAFHAARDIGRLGDLGSVGNFTHLEYVDAEDLVTAEREQQDFHLVRAGELGARIDGVEQVVVVISV